MSRYRDDAPTDDEPLGRPFLGAPPAAGGRPHGVPGTYPWPPPDAGHLAPPQTPGTGVERPVYVRYDDDHRSEVRPYLLTGGRTSALGAAVAMETVVLSTGAVPARASAAGLERARILRLAERPCSAAEVAARLHLPLQVALVLVTDLVAEGLLDATAVGASQADDVLFLERLIAGVAAL